MQESKLKQSGKSQKTIIPTAADIVEAKTKNIETSPATESQESETPLELRKNFRLLANYKSNCSKCHGKGHVGKIGEGSEERYLPCPKCYKNSWTFLDVTTGLIRFEN